MVPLLMVLTRPVSTVVPLAFQFSPLQLLCVLLAALAASRALRLLEHRPRAVWLSAEVMLSVALLSIALASGLPSGDGSSDAVRPDQGAALILRLVLGGVLVSLWHSLSLRVRPAFVRS